jgi:hypothetical protein
VRRFLPYLTALLLGAALAVAVGCGGRSNLIPPSEASNIKAQLAQIKSDVDAGNCTGLTDKLKRVHDDATNLPGTVDRRLRSRINEGVKRLQETAPGDCDMAAAAQTQTQTTETQPTETQTTETQTETTTTTTTPPPETTTTTPPATTTEPVPPTDTTTQPPATPPDQGTPPADNGGTPGGQVQVP